MDRDGWVGRMEYRGGGGVNGTEGRSLRESQVEKGRGERRDKMDRDGWVGGKNEIDRDGDSGGGGGGRE